MPAPKVVSGAGPSSRRRRAAHLLVAALAAAATLAAGPPVIGAVEVRGNTRTRDDVILRELLFAPGDTLDPAALEETERNLRGLLFLGDVRLRTEPAAPGSVRIVVEVRDLYARATSPLLSGDLEEVSWGLVAVDYNLLGRAQQARLTVADDEVRGRRVHGLFLDPRLAGSRLRLAAEAAWADEGHTLATSLAQPFHALAVPWAFGAALSSHAEGVRLYAGGDLTARYDDRVDAASLWLVRSAGRRVKVRPSLRVSVTDQRFTPILPFAYAPDDRRRVVPSLSLTVWRPRYVTDRFVQALGPQEDFQVGSWLALAIGASLRALGSDRAYPYAAVTAAPRHRFGSGWYLFGALSGSSRWRDGRPWHVRTAAELSAYRRLQDWPLSPTLAARLAGDRLDRPEDAGSQFLLGVDSGVRGLPARRYDGRRRVVASLELRPLLHQRRDWVLGAALFADTGAAWDEAIRWVPAAGAGLRLGLPRVYDTPVLRVDLARSLRDPAWQLSFGLGQYY